MLPLRARIKKNSVQLRVNRKTGKRFPSTSDRFKQWENAAGVYVRRAMYAAKHQTITQEIEVHYRFYFKNRQNEPDVSNCIEGIQDVMQDCGVFKNDKLIMRIKAEKFIGDKDERIEIEIYAMG